MKIFAPFLVLAGIHLLSSPSYGQFISKDIPPQPAASAAGWGQNDSSERFILSSHPEKVVVKDSSTVADSVARSTTKLWILRRWEPQVPDSSAIKPKTN
jgi:hypothetical protein